MIQNFYIFIGELIQFVNISIIILTIHDASDTIPLASFENFVQKGRI